MNKKAKEQLSHIYSVLYVFLWVVVVAVAVVLLCASVALGSCWFPVMNANPLVQAKASGSAGARGARGWGGRVVGSGAEAWP